MPQEQLYGGQVGSRFEQVCSEAVPQSGRPEACGETRAERRFMTRVPHRLVGDRLFLFRGFLTSREQVYPRLDLRGPPVLAQCVEHLLGQWQFTVARSLALVG